MIVSSTVDESLLLWASTMDHVPTPRPAHTRSEHKVMDMRFTSLLGVLSSMMIGSDVTGTVRDLEAVYPRPEERVIFCIDT